MLLHLLGSRGAVEAEDVDREGFENRHHRCDVGAHKHGACGFHGHRHHQGPPLARCLKGFFDSLQCRLDLKNVLTGLNDQQIDVAGDQPLRLLPKRGTHRVEIDVAKGGQLGGRSHGTGHKPGFLRSAVFIGHLTGQLTGPLVQFEGLIFETVFRQHDRGGTEGIRLDDITPDLQELTVHRLDRFGAGDDQILVATLELCSTEVFG